MVKANMFCEYAISAKECSKGYKKCTGQGCKCFEGNQKWKEYLVKRAEYKKQFE